MRRLTVLALCCALLPLEAALAGGFDTPIMYTARHMGMGGAAIGYVDDPSALFHNPAGLAHTRFVDVTLDFSPLIGGLKTSPAYSGQNVDSNLTFAPFFLGAAAVRVTDFLVLGVGVYPVASSGASYDYTNDKGVKTFDETRIAFFEVAPGLAVNLPFGFKLGAAWRATILQFQRVQHNPDSDVPGMFDMDMLGASYAGYRVGLEWSNEPFRSKDDPFRISAGLVFRSKTETTVEADTSTLVLQKWGKTSMPFVLPAKIGAGVKAAFGSLAAALDVEYGFYSQNDSVGIKAEKLDAVEGDEPFVLPNYYMWQDAITLRVGVEYTFVNEMKARVGYVMDGKTGNENYPSAFGTPPVATHSLTAGFGMKPAEFLELNVAYAYRFGSTTVGSAEEGSEQCLACSKPGEYSIGLHGFYLDAGLRF